MNKKEIIDELHKMGYEVKEETLVKNGVNVLGVSIIDSDRFMIPVFHIDDIIKKAESIGATARAVAEEMLDIIIPDLPFESGDEVVVLLSGLGATPVMEQYIVYNRVEEILTEKGIKVHRSYVGNYFTSLEMMGVTLTVMKLDDELKECIDMPANSVGLKQF